MPPIPRRRIEDLAAGTVVLLGIPWDENSSYRRGAARAPAAIRAALASAAANLCSESGRDLGAEPRFVDAGDLALAATGPAAADRISAVLRDIVARGAQPLLLGGDHAVTYPIVRGLGPAGLTVLQVDAHPDLYDCFDGNRLSHASPFARIMEAGLADRLVQVGIRTMNPHQRHQAERFGVEVVAMRDWHPDRATDLGLLGPVYVSIDLDGLDPSCAPGVAHPEPGGLGTRDLLHLVQSIPGRVVGADIVELQPDLDPDHRTAAVAAKLVKELADRMLTGAHGSL